MKVEFNHVTEFSPERRRAIRGAAVEGWAPARKACCHAFNGHIWAERSANRTGKAVMIYSNALDLRQKLEIKLGIFSNSTT